VISVKIGFVPKVAEIGHPGQMQGSAETALAAFTTPSSGGWVMFGKSPS
jgi:hypothetical protein